MLSALSVKDMMKKNKMYADTQILPKCIVETLNQSVFKYI